MNRLRWLRLLLVILIPSALGAAIYKWVDEEGVVHYADTPPVRPQEVQMVTPSAAQPSAAKTTAGPAAAEAGAITAAGDREMSRLQLQACGRARQELLTLQRGRAFRYDDKDDPAYLDDAAVQAETERLQAFIESECDGTPEQLAQQEEEAQRFAAQQAVEDRCVRARQRLAMMEKPESRTSPTDIATARREADERCRGATGDRTIILRRQVFIR